MLLAMAGIAAVAQVEQGGVRRRSDRERKRTEAGTPQVSERMQDFYKVTPTHDADLEYMRTIYRRIDLNEKENAPLYFPEDVIDGQENLFRILFNRVVEGKLPAYEYLDGREVFSDKYLIKIDEMLDRFGIYYTSGSGSRGGSKYNIEEADVPTSQVLNYYIIEKWEYDRRTNHMTTRIEAICPVLTRSADYGGEARYPMFWVKFDALRPYLAQQYVFLDDDNNLAHYSLDDYFNLGMYKGEIYKTQNLRNLSMAQMFPDEDDMKQAQDSIDRRLREYGKDRWVPTREEYLAMREKEAAAKKKNVKGDSLPDRTVMEDPSAIEDDNDSSVASESKRPAKKRATSRKPRTAKVKSSSSSSSGSGASRSVRRRKR